MYPPVTTKDPMAVEVEVQMAYLMMFPAADPMFIPRAFGWVIECFTGNYKDYQPVDARYHDFEHTLQGTLCMARILRGRHLAGAQPPLTQRLFELGLLAMLLHDTGYLKRRGDTEGTGTKYTMVHVSRSAEFAGELLGQMAADDYVDKLPILYSEFAEAARFTKVKAHFIGMFSSAADLMQKTPTFWDKFVQMKLDRDFGGLHRFLNEPYPDGPNQYLERIEANMERLRGRVAATSA